MNTPGHCVFPFCGRSDRMAVTFPVAPPYKDGQMFISWVADTVAEMGNEPFATWYGPHGKIEHDCSFAQLWKQAGCIAKRLLAEGLKKGDIVVTCVLSYPQKPIL